MIMSGFSIPGVTLGVDRKRRSAFDLSHSVHTTLSFGEVVPAVCQSMIAGSKVKLSNNLFARLLTMPLPVMGSIQIRNYFRYVNVEDVFPIWSNLVSGISIKGVIPSNVPQFQGSDFLLWLLTHKFTIGSISFACPFTFYRFDSATGTYKLDDVSSGDATTLISRINSSNAPAILKWSNNTVLSSSTGLSSTYCTNLSAGFNSEKLEHVSPISADVQIDFTGSSSTSLFKICFRYTSVVKHILKCLIGCGYQLSLNSTECYSVLPLLAYYKAWYDVFGNMTQKPWTDTYCYKYIQNFLNSPQASYTGAGFAPYFYTSSNDAYNWLDKELPFTYFMNDIDFITAHTSTPAIGHNTNIAVSSPTLAASGSGMELPLTIADDSQPKLNTGQSLSANALMMLLQYTKDINKNSIIRKRIDLYLQNHGLGTTNIETHSTGVGSAVQNVDISAVLATADSGDAEVGQYAGLGTSKGRNGCSFHANKQGYLFVLQCVTPSAGWCQGIDMQNVLTGTTNRYEWYDAMFDSVGFTLTPKSVMQGYRDTYALPEVSSRVQPGNLGYIPRYAGLKIKQNLINSDFVFRSTKTFLQPYTMDRIIDREDQIFEPTGSNAYKLVKGFNPATTQKPQELPLADTNLRYIGLQNLDWLGNFNRIFTVPEISILSPNPDPFILHNSFDVTYTAPMLSISDSYNTDEHADSTMTVKPH